MRVKVKFLLPSISFSPSFCSYFKNELGASLIEYGIAILLAISVGTASLIALANSVENNITRAEGEM